MAVHQNVLETIGSTPVIRLNRIGPPGVEIYVKAEAFNPMGSVKDRLALGVIEAAEAAGTLSPGQTVVEATSGNTGIGLAMVCAQKGYPLVVVMAENFSLERRKLMRFLGAKVVLTPAAEKGTGMMEKAKELAQEHGWFLTEQFRNQANADIHAETTAQEILADFSELGLDYWVTGFGTGGTLNGVGRVLKAKSPNTKVVVCEPDNVPILSSGIPQERTASGGPAGSHPMFRPHLVQGWSPDWIPQLAEDAVSAGLIDAIVAVGGQESMQRSRDLARLEGIFTGTSGGATLAGALKVAEQAPKGSRILAMLADTGERYLSTTLFEDIPVDMTPEETAISRSTPNYRFDVRKAPPVDADEASDDTELDSTAVKYVADVTHQADQPVVMFALEWCEFCWSARKFFQRLGLDFKSVDLDSVAYQEGNFGGEIRKVLAAQTGAKTIPQIYVGGTHIGGCTDLFDAFKDGSLMPLLNAADAAYDPSQQFDPYGLLPGWLHAR
ncbi:MAG: pyridoxal-phosphate dependent enzyme [Myxococcota bacterium]|nr:pyridoxal-phosphate dependent enzyme [Myxococcota bacterium]